MDKEAAARVVRGIGGTHRGAYLQFGYITRGGAYTTVQAVLVGFTGGEDYLGIKARVISTTRPLPSAPVGTTTGFTLDRIVAGEATRHARQKIRKAGGDVDAVIVDPAREVEPEMHLLTKILRDGSECVIRIVPEAGPYDDKDTTLGWWLEITRAGVTGRIKTRPHLMAAPVGDLTHALTLPSQIAWAKVIGLTTDETVTIIAGIDQWLASRQAAAQRQHDALTARVREAAPDAATWTISSPHGTPGVGTTFVAEDGRPVTVLRTWEKPILEDGSSFGLLEESGILYCAKVREATPSEATPVLEEHAAQRRREDVNLRVRNHIIDPATLPPSDEPMPDLWALPEVKVRLPLTHLRVDVAGGWVWVLQHRTADGDDWSRNNFAGTHIARRVPLTPERAGLITALQVRS